MRRVVNKYFLNFGGFAVALVIISTASAVVLYRLNIGGDFSKDPMDWSGFGSYVGGVLGPLVSFVTLLAVLKTVYLQKELLQTQRSEFKRLLKLQRKTYFAQERQVNNAISIAKDERMERARAACLEMLDRQLLHAENKIRRLGQDFEVASDLRGEAPAEAAKLCNEIKSIIVSLTNMTEEFQRISVKVSFEPYETPDILHEYFKNAMGEAYAKSASEV